MNTEIERTGKVKSNNDEKGNAITSAVCGVGFGFIVLLLGIVLDSEIMDIVGLSSVFLSGIGFIIACIPKKKAPKINDVSANKTTDVD